MKRSKRILSVVSLALALCIMTSCADNAAQNTTTQATTTTSATQSTTVSSESTTTEKTMGTSATTQATTAETTTAETTTAESTTTKVTDATTAKTTQKTTAKTTEKTTEKTTQKTVITTTTEENITMPVSQADYKATESNVKMLGRTYNDGNILWLALSASGIEFTFQGTSVDVTVVGDNIATSGNAESQARFAVYVNGVRTLDEIVTSAEKTYTVFSSDKTKTTTISIVKLSEAANSTMGIKNISATTVSGIKPTAKNDVLIEFIGDSITCGYGVDDEVKENHFSTRTEDATKGYAYKSAKALGVDYSMVSYSGYGIISGYTTGKTANTAQLVPDQYEKFAFSYGNRGIFNVGNIAWGFQPQPDIIVINLGTNDMSYCGSDLDRWYEYIAGYKAFLAQVRAKNPNAYILCTLGLMGTTLNICVQTAVEEFSAENGDTKISFFGLKQQLASDGYAADWHPTEKSQQKAADAIIPELRKIIDKL